MHTHHILYTCIRTWIHAQTLTVVHRVTSPRIRWWRSLPKDIPSFLMRIQTTPYTTTHICTHANNQEMLWTWSKNCDMISCFWYILLYCTHHKRLWNNWCHNHVQGVDSVSRLCTYMLQPYNICWFLDLRYVLTWSDEDGYVTLAIFTTPFITCRYFCTHYLHNYCINVLSFPELFVNKRQYWLCIHYKHLSMQYNDTCDYFSALSPTISCNVRIKHYKQAPSCLLG